MGKPVLGRKEVMLTPEQLERRTERLKSKAQGDDAFIARVARLLYAHLNDEEVERLSDLVDQTNKLDEAIQREAQRRCPWLFM